MYRDVFQSLPLSFKILTQVRGDDHSSILVYGDDFFWDRTLSDWLRM